MSRNRYKRAETKERVELDVVILTYKEYSYIKQVIESLEMAAEKTSYRVIVINNGDPKEEVNKVFSDINMDKVSLFHQRENRGFPAGCNIGVQKGHSPVILLLNSDAIMFPGSIDLMMDELKSDKTIGAVGPMLIFPDNEDVKGRPPGKIQHAGIEMGMNTELIHTFLGWSPDHPKASKKREPFAITGACLLTTRKLWNRLGGLDKRYGVGTVEDVDYCISVRDAGYKVVYLPEAKGFHYVGASAVKAQTSYPIQENMGLLYHKWNKEFKWSEWEVL